MSQSSPKKTSLLNILDKVDQSYQSRIQKKDDGIYPVSCFGREVYIQLQFSHDKTRYIVSMIDNQKSHHGLHIIHLETGENIVSFYYHGNKSHHPEFNPITVTTLEQLLEGIEKEVHDPSKFPPTDIQCPPPMCPIGNSSFSRPESCSVGYYFPRNGKCASCQSELDDSEYGSCRACSKITHYIAAKCDICGELWRDHLPKYERGTVFGGKKTYINE